MMTKDFAVSADYHRVAKMMKAKFMIAITSYPICHDAASKNHQGWMVITRQNNEDLKAILAKEWLKKIVKTRENKENAPLYSKTFLK